MERDEQPEGRECRDGPTPASWIADGSHATDYQGEGHVFIWEDGRPVHPDVLRQRFDRQITTLGLPRIRLHDLRRSYATAAMAAEVSPKIVSERLGHASVVFTLSQYTHLLPGLDRDAAHTVAAFLFGPTPHLRGRRTMIETRFVSKSVSSGRERRPEPAGSGLLTW